MVRRERKDIVKYPLPKVVYKFEELTIECLVDILHSHWNDFDPMDKAVIFDFLWDAKPSTIVKKTIINYSNMKYKNNPFNLRKGAKWLGLDDEKTKKVNFCVFKDLYYGIRAACILIFRIYLIRNPYLTVREMISIYAPNEDGNNEKQYLESIKALATICPDTRLTDLSLYARVSLLRAMAIIESQTYLERSEIKKALLDVYGDK